MYNKNIYVTIVAMILFVGIILFVCFSQAPMQQDAEDATITTVPVTTAVLRSDPVLFTELDYKVFYNIDQSEKYLEMLYQAVLEVDLAIASDEYSDIAISAMMIESSRIHDIILDIKLDIDKYTRWEREYYYAAKVYELLRINGFNAEVACGIIGNMMAECGGMTLMLNPKAYNSKEHGGGLCGWLYRYYPDASGASFEKQCDILLQSIERQFSRHSSNYATGFSYEKFLAMTSPEEAALAFAKIYERCASFSYGVRQTAAKTAYDYFVGDSN